jgi:hypothetical protein
MLRSWQVVKVHLVDVSGIKRIAKTRLLDKGGVILVFEFRSLTLRKLEDRNSAHMR